MSSRPGRAGPLALLVAAFAAPSPTGALATVLAPAAASPGALLAAGTGLLVQALAAWLLLVALLTLGARGPARLPPAAGCCAPRRPAVVRRAVALALGAGLALGLATPASAASRSDPHRPEPCPPRSDPALPSPSTGRA